MSFDNDKIFQDEKAWTRYDCGDEGDVCVYRRCPECGKYVKEGKLLMNMAGEVRLQEWKCKTHGEITPFFLRD